MTDDSVTEEYEDSVTEEYEEFSFVPEIECNKTALNGRIHIHVLNGDQLLENGKFEDSRHVGFQLTWRHISPITDDTENGDWFRNHEWIRNIHVANVSNEGKFDVIFPVFLHDYNIHFALRAINVRSKEWLSFTPPIMAHIPSMLIDTSFNIGDRVLFRPQQSIFRFVGIIEEVLDDNQYKIGYCDAEDVEKHDIVSRTRIFRDATPQKYEINLGNHKLMKKQMLIKRDDAESISVFESILDAYEVECYMYSEDCDGFNAAFVYGKSMATFLTKHIFEYLFEALPHFELKVNCLVDPHKDGKLTMQSLRHMAMTKYYNCLKDGMAPNICTKTIENAGDDYQCDLCYRSLNQFNFVFNCEANCTEQHDLCVYCVYNVIKLGLELEAWLTSILCDELNSDCINFIVDYVVGMFRGSYTVELVQKTHNCNNIKNHSECHCLSECH